jgi:hypothetical protein
MRHRITIATGPQAQQVNDGDLTAGTRHSESRALCFNMMASAGTNAHPESSNGLYETFALAHLIAHDIFPADDVEAELGKCVPS